MILWARKLAADIVQLVESGRTVWLARLLIAILIGTLAATLHA